MRRQGFEIKSSMIQMVFWIKTTKMLSKETFFYFSKYFTLYYRALPAYML